MLFISDKGIRLIKSYEGCMLRSYRCPAGKWTIGYGHTKDVQEDMFISQERADLLLVDDITDIERQLNQLQLNLTQHQFDAICGFVFNIGIGNFTKNSSLYKEVKENPCSDKVPELFSLWCKVNGKVNKGLQLRRRAEAYLYVNNRLEFREKALFNFYPA